MLDDFRVYLKTYPLLFELSPYLELNGYNFFLFGVSTFVKFEYIPFSIVENLVVHSQHCAISKVQT